MIDKGNSAQRSGPSQSRRPAWYLPTRKTVIRYSIYIILKVILCFLDQYSMIKYAFFVHYININH